MNLQKTPALAKSGVYYHKLYIIYLQVGITKIILVGEYQKCNCFKPDNLCITLHFKTTTINCLGIVSYITCKKLKKNYKHSFEL